MIQLVLTGKKCLTLVIPKGAIDLVVLQLTDTTGQGHEGSITLLLKLLSPCHASCTPTWQRLT